MNGRFWYFPRAIHQCLIALATFLAILSYIGNARAQQGGTSIAQLETLEQGGGPTLSYLLEALKADLDVPPVWYQLGLKLSKMPGYEVPASVWLDAYVLAVPNAPNAVAIREQIRQLRAASAPRAKEKLADQLEAIALDIRASLHEKQGERQLAIADFTRVIKLDPTQEGAREALKRLSVAPKPPEKPVASAPTTAPADAKPSPSTSSSRPKETGCMRIVGTWNWAFGALATFKADGTFTMQGRTGEGPGKWTCTDGKSFVLRHANEVLMTMGADGNTMTGRSSATGYLVRFTVHRKS